MTLERTQLWMQSVISHPAGIEAGIVESTAQKCFDLVPSELEMIVTRSKRLLAAERLAVYHNAYYARLMDCLREEFPVFLRTVGEEVFDAFAAGFLVEHPSRSYTLADLGASFPQYLVESRPAEEADQWSDFLIDLARLERAINEVFDGPGQETDPQIDPIKFNEIPVGFLPDTRIELALSLRLLTLKYPLHDFYRAVRKEESASPPAASITYLALHRRDYVVQMIELTAGHFELLDGLLRDLPIGQAIEKAYTSLDVAPEAMPAYLQDLFCRWASQGFFRSVKSPYC